MPPSPSSPPSFAEHVAAFFATPFGRTVYRVLVFAVWPMVVAGLGLPVEADVKTRAMLDMAPACDVCPVCPEVSTNTGGADHYGDAPEAEAPPIVDEAPADELVE